MRAKLTATCLHVQQDPISSPFPAKQKMRKRRSALFSRFPAQAEQPSKWLCLQGSWQTRMQQPAARQASDRLMHMSCLDARSALRLSSSLLPITTASPPGANLPEQASHPSALLITDAPASFDLRGAKLKPSIVLDTQAQPGRSCAVHLAAR